MLASTNHGDLGRQSTHLHVVLEWAHKARRRKMTEGTMPSSRQRGEKSQFGHQQSFHHFLSLQFLPERLCTEKQSRWQNSKIKPQKPQEQTCWSCRPDLFLVVVLDFLCQAPSGPPTFASTTMTWNCLATYWLPPPDWDIRQGTDCIYVIRLWTPRALAQALVHSSLSGMVFWVTGKMSRG